MTKREIATAATREKLINTAENILQKNGYEKMSVADIAKTSGVAKGTFYNYFEKKEDIIFELNKRHMDDLSDQIDDLAKESAENSIRMYLTNFLQIVVNSKVNMARQWVRFVASSSNQDKWQYDNKLLQKLFKGLITNQKLKPSIPIDDISLLLITEVYGIIFSWCISPTTIDPVTSMNKFCDIQLNSLLEPYFI